MIPRMPPVLALSALAAVVLTTLDSVGVIDLDAAIGVSMWGAVGAMYGVSRFTWHNHK